MSTRFCNKGFKGDSGNCSLNGCDGMGIKAVVFDGDKTLFYGLKKETKIRKLLEKKRIFFDEMEIKKAFGLSLKIRDLLIDRKLLRLGDDAYLLENQIRLILLGVECKRSLVLAQYLCDHWTGASDKKVFDDVKETLKQLKKFRIKIGLLTAGSSSSYIKTLKETNLFHYFDAVIGEDITNVPKPALIAYLMVVQKLGVSPSEAVMVGDHVENDYAGPLKAGLNAVLIDRENSLSRKYKKINSLKELLPLIKQLNNG